MALLIVFLPKAKADLIAAAEWYEKKQYGLGKRFKMGVIDAIESLDNSIKEYGIVYQNLSRIFVKKFPYVIYFKKDTSRQRVVIFAILRGKQDKEATLDDRL